MLKNYLKIAYRSLLRNRAFSLINILGLAVGLASSLILFAYVEHERSFDTYHPDSDRVYRVVQQVNQTDRWAWTGGAVAPMLRDKFPDELEEVVSLAMTTTYISAPEGVDPLEKFRESNFVFADAGLERVFHFEVVKGSWKGVFDQPFQIVLTETSAKKYFGDQDPIGKSLVTTGDFAFQVRAVIKDLPFNTHLKMDLLTGMASFKATEGFPLDSEFGSFWWPQTYTYAKLSPGAQADQISDLIPKYNTEYRDPEEAKNYRHYLQPLLEIHLDSSYQSEWTPSVSEQSLWIIGSIAVFVLVLACINFINLATARAIKRMKEIGIRKVSGAQRGQLIGQFLAESFLINAISLVTGLVLVYLLIPTVQTQLEIIVPLDLLSNGRLQVMLLTVWVGSSLLAGFFPAIYLSGLRPELILKQSGGQGGKALLRKSLVVFQFVLASLLVFCASVAYVQHTFLSESSPGFEVKNLMAVKSGRAAQEKGEVLKEQLQNLPGVKSVRFASNMPGVQPGWNPSVDYPGMEPGKATNLNVQYVDAGYFEALGVGVIAGREFDEQYQDGGVASLMREQFPALDGVGMIVNASAAAWMGKTPEEALGGDLRTFTEENGLLFSNYKGKIVGVVADYHTQDLRYPIVPTIYLPAKNAAFDGTAYLMIRTDGEDQSKLLDQMKATWKELIPGIPFEYEWVDTTLENQYREQAKTGLLLGGFAFLTLLISGLGLYGLSLFATESRRKEIGIRRVLGASVGSIVGRFSGEFLILVGIALCIALPVGYFLMEEWLDQFAQKVSISVWFFMLSALLTSLVAYLTVSVQSYRAALQNPVNSIKAE